jgi:uncharacterized protein (TIGR03089 family)
MTTPYDLLAGELARDGSRPMFTYYDDASGERVELSVATTANWVAKTASFLVDEYDVDAGDTVRVSLPLHWQTAVVLLACWAVGAQVSFGDPAALTVTTPGAGVEVVGEVLELSLAPMGADFSRLVAAQPDAFSPISPAGDDLVAGTPTDLPNGARVLTVVRYDTADALGYGLIAPMAVAGSAVLVRHVDESRLADHVAAERVTHTLGVDVAGLPRVGG